MIRDYININDVDIELAAKKMNCRTNTLKLVICGNALPGKNFALKLSKYFGITKEQIFENSEMLRAKHIYSGIISRCFNEKSKAYSNYGKRGITVCYEWTTNFDSFYDFISKLPHFNEEGYSLDRIDNDGNYDPMNVRFATRKTQNFNRRKSRKKVNE